MRWAGDARVGVSWEAQRVFLGSGAWCVFAGSESSRIGVVKFDSLDAALRQCDQWKGDLPVSAAGGETTGQSDRFRPLRAPRPGSAGVKRPDASGGDGASA